MHWAGVRYAARAAHRLPRAREEFVPSIITGETKFRPSSPVQHSTKNPAFISIEWTVNVGAYINVFIIYKLLKVNWLWSKSINVFYKCNYLYHI